MEKDRNRDDVGKEEEWKAGKEAVEGGGGVLELRCCVKVGRRAVFTLAERLSRVIPRQGYTPLSREPYEPSPHSHR